MPRWKRPGAHLELALGDRLLLQHQLCAFMMRTNDEIKRNAGDYQSLPQ
eukprot:COSAG02_NODE_67181_length_253_cov_1.051948_1_plen_48_part_01